MHWRTVALALALSLGLAADASAAQFDTTLISRATGAAGVNAGGEARESSISGDGRFVAFRTAATNLSPDDGDATADVYVRDRQTSATTLVSRASGTSG